MDVQDCTVALYEDCGIREWKTDGAFREVGVFSLDLKGRPFGGDTQCEPFALFNRSYHKVGNTIVL